MKQVNKKNPHKMTMIQVTRKAQQALSEYSKRQGFKCWQVASIAIYEFLCKEPKR